MAAEKVDLHGSAATLLLTLYMRAWDARQRNPILGDRYAAEVMDRIQVDPGFLRFASGEPRIYLRPLLAAAGLLPAMRDSMRLHRCRFTAGAG